MPNKHLYPHFLKCFFILVFFHNSQMVPSLNSKHQEAADTFLIRTLVTGQMTHPIPVWPHLNYILRCCFQVRSHSQVPGSRASTCLSGGLGSSHNRRVELRLPAPEGSSTGHTCMASPRGEGSTLEEGDHICRSVAVSLGLSDSLSLPGNLRGQMTQLLSGVIWEWWGFSQLDKIFAV